MSVRQARIEHVYSVCEGRKSSDTLSSFVTSSIAFTPQAFAGWKTSHHQKQELEWVEQSLSTCEENFVHRQRL